MHSRAAFHVDCTPVIAECGFECSRCIQEIESVLTKTPGVGKVYRGTGNEDGKLFVEHDPSTVTVEQLIDILKTLPSFYEEYFIPTAITA